MSAHGLPILRQRPGFKGNPDNFTCRCPGHEDHENSLSVKVTEKGIVLMNCHAGCKLEDILTPLELKPCDLFQVKVDPHEKPKKQFDCAYDYAGETGKLLFQVVRWKPKGFSQRRPDPNKPNGWVWSLNGVDRVLYRLPDVLAAKEAGRTVYLCEGEKDVNNLTSAFGVCATTNAGGVAKWSATDAATLTGANVVILPDNDKAGIAGAWKRHDSIPGSVIVLLPDLPAKGDVSDWLAAGGTLEQLAALVALARENPPQRPVDTASEALPAESVTEQVPTRQLPSGAPRDMARHVLGAAFGGTGLKFWRGEPYRHTGPCYEPLEVAELERLCYEHLENAYYVVEDSHGNTTQRLIVPDIAQIKRTIHAMQSLTGVLVPSASDHHVWTGDGNKYPPAERLLSVSNGLLDMETRIRHPHDPAFFNLTALDFPYDPAADAEDLTCFLESSLPGETGIKAALLLGEWFGYCLAPTYEHHRILWLMGKRRGGKGVISRLLRNLLGGPSNVAGPQLSTFGDRFALQSFIGKRLAIFADVKDVGRIDMPVILERLKNISGQDLISIPRKHVADLTITLPTKIMMCGNATPQFQDDGGALAVRVMVIDFPVSFAGCEDLELEKRLAANLSGALNWALDGYARLQANGRFTEVESGWRDDFIRASDPVRAFVDDMCDVRDNAVVPCPVLYQSWSEWCEANGNHPGNAARFGARLRGAGELSVNRRRMNPDGSGRRQWVYAGITLKMS